MEFVDTLNRTRSAQLFEEAKKYFPGGVNSPVRAFKSVSGPPLFIKEGQGCRITDEDDNTYIDFCCSWGPLILGHNNARIRELVLDTVAKGTSFGTPNKLGNQLGKLIIENNRFIDKIRFVSSGTEAVMSAIRLARGITGKSKVIKFDGCYHGHVDSLLVKAGSGLATFGVSTSAGIPESFAKETIVLQLDDRKLLDETLQEHHEDIACIIVEPVPANNGLLLQSRSFLECLRLKCYKYGVLLIFDEVISGFRVGFEGAAGHYGIQPDIMSFAKGITSGYLPLGGIQVSDTIREVILNAPPAQRWMHAYTYSGHATCCAVAIKNIEILERQNLVAQAAQMGERLQAGLQGLMDEFECVGNVRGLGLMCAIEFVADRETKTSAQIAGKILQNCLDNGLLTRVKGESLLLAPPLVIVEEEVDQILAIVRQGIESVL